MSEGKGWTTPGPWTVTDNGTGVCYFNEANPDDPRSDSVIAECAGFGAFSGIPEDEARANAALISRAPQMALDLSAMREALEECAVAMERFPEYAALVIAATEARRALAGGGK